jgi:hypothetical protein
VSPFRVQLPLRTLTFRTQIFERIQPTHRLFLTSVKGNRTEVVADMMLVSKRFDGIPFCVYTFDYSLWDSPVAPRIECNLYRKRLRVLEKIEVPSTRAAFMARALAHLAKKPSLLYMALFQNRDIICDYLGEAFTRDD